MLRDRAASVALFALVPALELRFEPDGYPLTTLIGDADLSRWGAEYISANEDIIRGRQIAADMTPEKRFWGPTGVVIDTAGHVMVVESCRHRIQVYDRVEYDDV